jgi:hypothetical protein
MKLTSKQLEVAETLFRTQYHAARDAHLKRISPEKDSLERKGAVLSAKYKKEKAKVARQINNHVERALGVKLNFTPCYDFIPRPGSPLDMVSRQTKELNTQIKELTAFPDYYELWHKLEFKLAFAADADDVMKLITESITNATKGA